MNSAACPFCQPDQERVFYRGERVIGIWDAYPVSPGHALLIATRHVSDWFEATPAEQTELLATIQTVKAAIEARHKPDGYNIGLNIGAAAGQTVLHLHLHVIPRYHGDVADPRGGVRYVIPAKANYLRDRRVAPYAGTPPHARALVRGIDDPLFPHLIAHLDRAVSVDIAVAFTLDSGIRLIQEHLRDVLKRGGRVRFLTGDYLGVTEPEALLRLNDLDGHLEVRVFESGRTSFHPKAYIIWTEESEGIAFVGSSNLTETALRRGVEWNYRIITSHDASGFKDVVDAFEALFTHSKTRQVDATWIEEYRGRHRKLVAADVPVEPPLLVPSPHAVQQEALRALAATRAAGNTAGLVVLATGLGKTWLSAFDCNQPEFRRVLFVAHRDEILTQARDTYRTIRPNAQLGLYTGQHREASADVVFASIQTLGRQHHLDQFDPKEFDYIVVDEFHHASAPTYRRLIEHFEPKFLLGLTATPERTDGGDLLALCGENLVYRCDLVEGIRRGLLCPFDYYGVPDEVDYSNIPWRNRRFDDEALTRAVATQARAENALEQYRKRAQSRAIGFCVSQRHADFMAEYFRDAGLRAVAVHSGETSAPRAHSLEQLNDGELDILFAVDMFNEGVDLPNVDTIMMLRPTESQILWLQQFGRGLRPRPGKRLQVIDYIGNHRAFLIKPRTLFQLGPGDGAIREAFANLEAGTLELPPGCSVTYELEAKDIIQKLLRRDDKDLRAYYIDFVEREGVRPLAVEAFHDGFAPQSARRGYGSWLSFVNTMGGLSPSEQQALHRYGDFLEALETTPMVRSFKMLVLLAMLTDAYRLEAQSIDQLSSRVARLARHYAGLQEEFGTALEDPVQLRRLLEENPIAAWTGGRGTGGQSYFAYENGVFSWRGTIAEEISAPFGRLVSEIADWRLASYLRRVDSTVGSELIICTVSHANTNPMLFLPARERQSGIPEGWVTVIADGVSYQANFVKIAVNVMRKGDSGRNMLPEVLQKWFGADAGKSGTNQKVVFERGDDGYIMRPLHATGPVLWKPYMRQSIPPLFGLEFNKAVWEQGWVPRPDRKLIALLVTLEKDRMQAAHRYADRFLAPDRFQWQSQNRTTRDSATGRMIENHQELGLAVHLFVRRTKLIEGKAAPFIYCGELEYQGWDRDKPITVWWKLKTPVPERLWASLQVP